jgi:hypothetical protein
MAQKFFYDGQIRRFIVQFIRVISEFEVEFGKDRAGNTTLQRVPVFYGDGSRQAAYIIRGGSENSMPTVPAMAVYINSLSYARDRVQEPNFVDKMHIRQRQYNEDLQVYEAQQGNAFTIERLMPVPYKLELKVDIWTSNTEQKLQLIEQLGVLFNPGLEVQSTDNYIDWTSLSVIYLNDINWSSRSVGATGTENPIDIATLTFELPIWISAPAKVKKLGVIQKIITNIHDAQGNLDEAIYSDTNLLGARQYFTPLNYRVLLIGNELTLLKANEIEDPREPTLSTPTKIGTKDQWKDLINLYGVLNDGVSLIRLESADEITEVVGTVSYHPTDDSKLLFNPDIDTLPTNTISPINAIVDPKKSSAADLAMSAVAGTRFLILNNIGSFNSIAGSGPIAWKGIDNHDLVAYSNDIIEFNGTHWNVVFDSQTDSGIQYVSNLNTGTQYKWNNSHWIKSWEGEYKGGLWSLVL